MNAKPGDLLVHHSLTIHLAEANNSPDRPSPPARTDLLLLPRPPTADALDAYQRTLVEDLKRETEDLNGDDDPPPKHLHRGNRTRRMVDSVHAIAAEVKRAETNRMVELSFTSTTRYSDPFNDVQLDVVFTQPDGTQLRVPAFWAGGDQWQVRYASGQPGVHEYRSECTDKSNASLQGVGGRVEITPYSGHNPLYRHGPPARRRRPPALRTGRRHAISLARRHVVDGVDAAVAVAGRVPDARRRPSREGLQRRPDRGRALSRHGGVRRARCQRDRLSVGTRLQPHPAGVL